MNSIIKLASLIFIFIVAVSFIIINGCNSNNTTSPSPASYPSINMSDVSTIYYTNDSVDVNYVHHRTSLMSEDNYFSTTASIGGQTCVAILDKLSDTLHNQIRSTDTIYVYYNSTAGKFYQWGLLNSIVKQFDTAYAGTPIWDLVADFSASGSWNIESNVPVVIGRVPLNIRLTGAVIGGATTDTSSNGGVINACYHIELTGALSTQANPPVQVGDIYAEYYLGTSLGGMMRLFVKPLSIPSLYSADGWDRNIERAVIIMPK